MAVRCRRQDAGEKPLFARPRLSADPREFSGALGNLGTLLSYLLAAIVTVGPPAAGVLLGFGLSTGLGNLLLAPFGALPLCHGAGGLAAQYRFGGRSGTPPLALGLVLLAAGLLLGEQAAVLLQAVPEPLLGALLLIAALELGRSARPQALRGRILAVVGGTAVTTLLLNPAAALLGGLLLERLLRERNRR